MSARSPSASTNDPLWIRPGKESRPRSQAYFTRRNRRPAIFLCHRVHFSHTLSQWFSTARRCSCRYTRRMDDVQVWTFERGSERLIVRRRTEPDAFAIEIETGDGVPRAHRFEEEDQFLVFQSDLQYMLVHSGWTLVEFEPDRRKGRDRRGFP